MIKKCWSFVCFFILAVTAFGQNQKITIPDVDSAIYTRFNFSNQTIDTISNEAANVICTGPFRFNYCNINDDFDFEFSRFEDTVEFFDTKFYKWVEFSESVFSKKLEFLVATVFEKISFDSSSFSGRTLFMMSKFYKGISFKEAHFKNNVTFSTNDFSGNIDFRSAKFEKKVVFSDLTLNDDCKLDFRNTILGDSIEFINISKIPNLIDLTAVDFKVDNSKPILINLYKSDISNIKLDYVHFKLFFQFDSLQEKTSGDEKEITYQALLSNFKSRGQQESYKLLDIEHQTFKWQNSWASWLVWVPKYWWNFGYDKQYIFIWTFFFLIFFTFTNYFIIYSLNANVYKMENVTDIQINKWRKKFGFNDFLSRLWFTFIYTASIFFRITLKLEKINFNHKIGVSYLILIYVLGLVCLAYMANFVIQK